jgi:hypothetical protein
MGYSRSFGFRSFENIVRRGREKTPTSGSIKIGAPITIDPAAPGKVKAAAAGASTAGAGVAVYEHVQAKGLDAAVAGTADFDAVPANQFVQRVSGKGVKVWLKNSAAKTLADGRVIPANNLLAGSVVLGSLALGAQLTPDGSGAFKVANGTTDGNWLTVESVNTTTGVVEATLNF